jgi:hypothetical protein
MAKRCPSCRTEVADDARVCPNCPWIFPEEEAEDLPPSAVATGWSPLPLVITALVAASIGVGWYFVVKVYREETTPEAAQPAQVQAPPPAPEAAAPPPPMDSAPPRTTVSSPAKPAKPVPAPKHDEAEPPLSVTVVQSPPAKKVIPVKEWKLRGFVYDLMTLQPVPRCKVTLSDLDTSANFETSTDASGRYRAILPPLPDRGYLIYISKPGYASSYLDPGTEGVRGKSADERQRLCKELSSAVQPPSTLQPHGADPLVTDFHIAPQSCR